MVTVEGAAHNMARGNEMTLNYYGHDDPCAGGLFPRRRARQAWHSLR